MSGGIDGIGGPAKIMAGIAVFIVSWIIQASLGDSSMFSMSYVDRGFLQGLLVNVTFWPGWVVTIGFIGSGIIDLLDAGDPSDARPKPWETD